MSDFSGSFFFFFPFILLRPVAAYKLQVAEAVWAVKYGSRAHKLHATDQFWTRFGVDTC